MDQFSVLISQSSAQITREYRYEILTQVMKMHLMSDDNAAALLRLQSEADTSMICLSRDCYSDFMSILKQALDKFYPGHIIHSEHGFRVRIDADPLRQLHISQHKEERKILLSPTPLPYGSGCIMTFHDWT